LALTSAWSSIVDDLLDLKAETQETGKPRFSDLREGRITLPLIRAIKTWPEEQKKKSGWLAEKETQRVVGASGWL